jgi:hypothetical protein
MKENELNPAQSLDIIQTMINTAKNRLADDGFLLILWGWLVFSASLIHYGTITLGIANGGLVWAIGMPLGAVISIIYSIRKRKKEQQVRTYIDSYLGYVWTAFVTALFLTLIFMPVHSMKTTYFFLMILYGIATLISGGLLNFRPLIIGSLFSFLFAALSVFATEEQQFLCIAASLLFSYIIPGHLLQSKYKSQVNV